MKNKTYILMIIVVLVGVACPQSQNNPASENRKAFVEDSQPLKVVHRAVPIYPEEAKAKGITGTLVVEAMVDGQGNVVKARIIDGPRIFWDAALTAVKAWKFAPATSQGRPVEKTTQVKISFCDGGGGIGRGC